MISVFWMLSFFLILIFIFTLFYFTVLYWFCHTLTWIHHGCTWAPKHEPPLTPPSPHHSSGSSPCTSPKHPVSCVQHRLALRFLHESIHVSMPFSSIIYQTWIGHLFHIWYYTCFNAILPNHPPSPSPTESKSLFYTFVSLFLSCIQGYHYHLSKFQIYVLVYGIGVFLSGLLHSVQSAPVSSTSLELIQMYSL